MAAVVVAAVDGGGGRDKTEVMTMTMTTRAATATTAMAATLPTTQRAIKTRKANIPFTIRWSHRHGNPPTPMKSNSSNRGITATIINIITFRRDATNITKEAVATAGPLVVLTAAREAAETTPPPFARPKPTTAGPTQTTAITTPRQRQHPTDTTPPTAPLPTSSTNTSPSPTPGSSAHAASPSPPTALTTPASLPPVRPL
mmetsp:Transcript_10875/g.22765  ORF Transcript_10875/g.22765 Transcript_10875/m.22765 type:complete len:201 (-) Transcript_10875:1137-1739(-)